ncbi:MAG: MBL fold metallo-hydrolase [Rikenellaceae bacterium]
MKIEVIFLGTGTSQGVPVIGCSCDVCRSDDRRDGRLRSSVAIRVDGRVFVIDTSMDFRQQILREGITRLDGVIYTHEHRDHTGGLDDVRAFNYFQRRDMDLYCTERVEGELRKMFHYAFARSYPGVPRLRVNRIENRPFEIQGVRFVPVRGTHSSFEVFGFRLADFAYLTDFKTIDQCELKKLEGVKVLVVNALRREEHLSHFNLDQALELIKKINPEKAYLTHISHQMGLHAEVSRELGANVALAYDGLKLEF